MSTVARHGHGVSSVNGVRLWPSLCALDAGANRMAVQGCTCEWRQGSEWGYWHAPCEALQNPCGPRRARRPAPPSVTPAWIRCPPAGAHHAVRWRSCEAGTLPSAAHQIHTAVHTVLRRHGTRHGATASDTVLAPARRDPVVGRRGRNEFALVTRALYPRSVQPSPAFLIHASPQPRHLRASAHSAPQLVPPIGVFCLRRPTLATRPPR